ncbi:hypothetical protein HLV39_15760 [Marinobacter adhaerens]|uniref:Uncharacterized protein n=1 Tax=Marinobacter adhaerens TaxID=1033846 RepID=A0A851HTG5_9GAMM|nr:hypothetical protein [Marinobacter adhaerens]NWN92949.1 hypothetical protein [Marinobacter adhaerens]
MAKSLDLDLGKPAQKSQTAGRSSLNTRKREAGSLVDLNFKVTPEFKREFKLWAASHDLKQKEVLEEAFRALKRSSL